MREEKISIYRVLPILGMVISALTACGILCFINKLEIDQMICVAFVTIAFLPILILELTYERHREMLGENTQTNYKRAAKGFLLTCLIMLGISFMPEFFRPVLIFPLIMSAFSNDIMGMITGLYFNVLLTITTGGSFYELLAYIMLVLIGGMLSKMLKYMAYRLYVGLIFLFSSILFPNIFYYFVNESISLQNLAWGMINGLIIAIYVIVFYPNIRERTKREKHYYYGDILADDYVQVREVQNYSMSEYKHAKKVSDIAFKYALRLDLDADLAAAGGFYYRLGRWEGDPPIENGVRKASELCFPENLIQILREYNASDDLPSTPESALIHMIDASLIKMELLDEKVGTSQWNKEVLIYQTLNDFSTAGCYDKSGLSINAFIKIREWLAKEELL